MDKSDARSKRIAIDKVNGRVMLAVGIASFIVVFSLFAGKGLVSQGKYHSKVIKQKQNTLNQLKKNTDAANKLDQSYKEFVGSNENILGGDPRGTGDRDGDNSRIVLDALPSQYDFPALATSIEKMLKDNNFPIQSIVGTDDEIAQAQKKSESNPQAVEMPFTFEVKTSPNSAKDLIGLLERSIRPIQVQKLTITEQTGQLSISVEAKTFFQPGKSLDVKKEVVKP